MIIVQETFVCKPGNASKLAKLFKDIMTGRKEFLHVLSDVTGQYNRVIITTQYDNLAAYEKIWETMTEAESKKMQEAMKGYTEMYLTGSREIFRLW